jgi:archaellum component FlaG (FlaF/FlaG flagellin family)
MNSGKNNKENNCQSITVIVDGAIRILIYTGRKVQINEELMYSYGKDFRY